MGVYLAVGILVAYIFQPSDHAYVEGKPHGLIAAPSDQSKGIRWGCYETIVGASCTELGSGQMNTKEIIRSCNESSAAILCNNLTIGGYTVTPVYSTHTLARRFNML